MEVVLNRTQKRVFDYLTEHGSISTLDAFVDLGETRLSARIFELKEKGICISSKTKAVTNRFGEKRTIKEYRIG